MAKDDIKRYSLEELQAKHDRGETLTRADAPEIELDEHFWRNARIVMLTRMNAVLRAYVETQKQHHP